jgi:hypothetical protein
VRGERAELSRCRVFSGFGRFGGSVHRTRIILSIWGFVWSRAFRDTIGGARAYRCP